MRRAETPQPAAGRTAAPGRSRPRPPPSRRAGSSRGPKGITVWRAARHAQYLRRLLAQLRPLSRLDLCFHGIEVETRALLHRRERDRSLDQLDHLLLNEHEAPELVLEPFEIRLRSVLGSVARPAGALERIETQVRYVRHIGLGLVTQPAVGLVDEAEFVIADAHRAERAFAEIPDHVAIRRALAGDHGSLVVAVEVVLVGPVSHLLALLQFFDDVRVAGSGHQSREPVEPGDKAVLDLARGYLARPADHRRDAETALHDRALGLRKRGLPAVRPGEDLGAVVGGEDDDGVVVHAAVLQLLHHDADVVIHLLHAGLVDGPAVLGVAQLLVLVRQVRDDVHPGRIEPQEERLLVGHGLVDELERKVADLVVHGFHAFRAQFSLILDLLFADLAPARIDGRVVDVGRERMDHVPRADDVAEFLRIAR